MRWVTGQETNNRGFEVQRSINGTSYTVLGFVHSIATSGNSSIVLNYNFYNNDVQGEQQYYRLRQTDMDGRTKNSDVVLINGDRSSFLLIAGLSPNPATFQLNVTVESPGKDHVIVVITDQMGRIVRQQGIDIDKGSSSIPVNISTISKGSYRLQLTGSKNVVTKTFQFIKQ